jgi:hypothetical protein
MGMYRIFVVLVAVACNVGRHLMVISMIIVSNWMMVAMNVGDVLECSSSAEAVSITL